MIRKAFRMAVHPGQVEAYEQRHKPIWDELEGVLKQHGVHNYSIFHDPADNALFAYVEIEDEARWGAIADTESCRKWWRHMSDLMPSHADHRPISNDLNEVFHLD